MIVMTKNVWCKCCEMWVEVQFLGKSFLCPFCSNFILEKKESRNASKKNTKQYCKGH